MASSTALGAFAIVENSPGITDPPAAVRKNSQIQHHPALVHELDQLTHGHGIDPVSQPPTPSRAQTPTTPNELESSRAPSPRNREAVEALQSLWSPPINKWRFASCCLMCFANGLNDSAPGALIPYMEKTYSIGYAIVSLIFISNAIGFISAAPLIPPLLSRFGRAKTLIISQLAMLTGHLNILLAYWAYRHYETDHPPQHNTLLRTSSGHQTSKSELLLQALRNKTTASSQ
ncbi:MAG: hypothetical protein Q9208_000009 [Pyrenodesmia sp. 3 TL-2023]